ncbi:MAG: glycosyltransferase [Bacteroidota bacterium]
MIRVLYLSYDGLTDPLGQSQILPYLRLLSHEFSITIISFEKGERYVQNRDLIESICSENHIQWEPVTYHKFPPVISTLYDLWKLKRKAEFLHSVKNFDILHCRSYVASLVGMSMKRKYGTRFLFDMRGFWADERIESGLWNRKNFIYRSVYRFFKRKEKDFVMFADHIISLTHRAKSEILSWGNIPAPITVIPTCVDLALFDPGRISDGDKITLRQELKIHPDDFVLLYLGSWGSWYLTHEMLNYFREIKKTERSAKFLIITPDPVHLEGDEFKEDVIIRTSLRGSVPLFVAISNAAIFFIKPSYAKMASSATKMGEIMAMQIPFITNSGWGDVDEIIAALAGKVTEIKMEGIDSFEITNGTGTRNYCFETLSLRLVSETIGMYIES